MNVEPVVNQRAGNSAQSWLVFRAARLMLRPLLTYWPLTRWGLLPLPLVDSVAGLLPPPRGVRFERVGFTGFHAEWVWAEGVVRPDETDNPGSGGAVLYFHGGAFLACGLATHRREVARISAACGLPVLSVGYRQLPTVGLAGSLQDCRAVYDWLLEQGLDPARIVFAGDSAGGYLAFATALAARDAGLVLPGGIVALSPWLDLDATAKQAHPNAALDAYAPASRLPTLAALLAGLDADPGLSPVNQDLTGLPPVLIMAAEHEMLRCDAELMTERLATAGVPCALQIWAGQVHAFPVLGNLLPESRAAIEEIGAFVRRIVTPRTRTGPTDADPTDPEDWSVLAG
ncbi:MAG TPA: alpha/beta hydrolase [Pseudonocardiaceae bacterium]|jgi:acetyl esterase/lipase|nr:alpha/beta hydrolase [Pseudonocardiaceae bacterium]